MTLIVLARHGVPIWPADRYTGSSDIELSDEGRAQAARLGVWAAGAGLSEIWSSSLSRARDTADIVAESTGLQVTVDPRLVELDFGAAEGLTSEQMRNQFPVERQAFEIDPAANPLPGGEYPHLAVHRLLECARDIEASAGDGRVLVITHATAIRLFLCHLLGIPLREYRRLMPWHGYTAITEVRFSDGQGALLQYNAALEPIVQLARARTVTPGLSPRAAG